MLTIDICSSYAFKKIVCGIPKVSCTEGVCPGCVLGKQHQDPFPNGTASHATSPLELVHSDLMPFSNRSFSGAKYALTFIDDFSRHSWVYFLMYKTKFLSLLKPSRPLLRSNHHTLSRNYAQIMGGSMSTRHSWSFARHKESSINIRFLIPLNKMVSLKGRT